MKNWDLLWHVYDYIESHPSEWDQREWCDSRPACGTTYCFAGHAIRMVHPDVEFFGTKVTIDGEVRRTSEVASELLGINYDEASVLFGGRMSLAGIRRTLDNWNRETTDA